GEFVAVPAVEGRESDAVLGRVDEPAVPDVDAHVTDLGGARPGTPVAEEDDVRGLQVLEVDEVVARDLAAHLIRRAAAEDGRQAALTRVRLQLVDAPHET